MYILIVDDDKVIVDYLVSSLQKEGHKCFSAFTGEQAAKIIDSEFIQVCILDYHLPDTDGLSLMQSIKEKNPAIVNIFITAETEHGTTVEAVRKGAYDFLEKPFSIERITVVLKKAENEFFQQNKVRYLENKINTSSDTIVVGSNPRLKEILSLLDRVAQAKSFSVLIKGETGTGKELIARYLHQHSPRKNQPFIEVNCSAIPANLLESELFGYEQGAFTGADRTKIGLFELANQGVLFLDEIGDMPMDMQVKLLRALESRTIRRIGGKDSIPIDIALVSATNCDLEKAIANKGFREDLFYRINVIQVTLPPLRERREDIPELVGYFIKKYNLSFNKSIKGISEAALDLLYRYQYPGNIRELKNMIERAMLLELGDALSPAQFDYVKLQPVVIEGHVVATEALPLNYGLAFQDFKQQVIDEAEKKYLITLLKKTEGNVTLAAASANIQRTSFSRLLSKHNVYFKEFKKVE
jgi:two-component system response regulator AtoC